MIKKVAFVNQIAIEGEYLNSVTDEDNMSIRYARRDFAEGILISYPNDVGRVGVCYIPMSNVKYVIESSVER